MKRIRDLLMSISILFSVFIVIFITFSIFNVKRTVELTSSDLANDNLEIVKKKVNDMADDECKLFLNEIIEYLDKGNFDGKVKINDLYDYLVGGNTLLFYNGAKEKCNINDNELKSKSVGSKFLSNLMLLDGILDKYIFAYELKIPDELRLTQRADIDSTSYTAYRSNLVNILQDYLDILEAKEG